MSGDNQCSGARDYNKCGGDSRSGSNGNDGKQGGPPEPRPAWMKCPAVVSGRQYPVPDGVNILPISQGGRNGGPTKKQFKCGQCGQDATKPKPDAKPNAPADCPMMKARCPDGCDKGSGKCEGSGGQKGGSMLDKIKGIFGGGKTSDLRLVEACKHLKVVDEQITHHRDVFNTSLVCRKDGYFSPFITRVDCQGVEPQNDECACPCGNEEVVDVEEEGDEDCVDEDDDEGIYFYDNDEEAEEEDCVEEEETEFVAEEAEEECVLEAQVTEEECVEDAEGECVIEESAECMDAECTFFFDKPVDKKAAQESFEEACRASGEEDDKLGCVAMNNFIIRVQAPTSSGKTTNETCEQIIERLTSKKPKYPEPGPRPEKSPETEAAAPAEAQKCEDEIQLVVRQISVEDTTCECLSKPKKCKKKDLKPPIEKECEIKGPDPPPVEAKIPDDCKVIPPLVAEPPCNPVQLESDPTPPPPPPPPEEKKVEISDSCRPPPARVQNDCETLTEAQLLKMPIKDIKCGCLKEICSSGDEDACSSCDRSSVWTPPPPPPCPRCGAAERGRTEDCYLCGLTKIMRSGCPLKKDERQQFVEEVKIKAKETALCTPEYLDDGSMKYKGGMCMCLANKFIWLIKNRTPAGGFFDRFTGDCGEDARLQAITGAKSFNEAHAACYNSGDRQQLTYDGGNNMQTCCKYLWGQKQENQEEEQEVDKKPKCQPAKPETPPPTPPDQCPPLPKSNKSWFSW